MSVGPGIALLALGAILAFAVSDPVRGVDVAMVGYILMAAGVVGVIAGLVISNQRRHTSHTVVEDRHIREN